MIKTKQYEKKRGYSAPTVNVVKKKEDKGVEKKVETKASKKSDKSND